MGLNAEGHCGGLVWAWFSGFYASPLVTSQNWIRLKTKFQNQGPFFITGIYGPPHLKDKYKLWQFIMDIGCQIDSPWLIIGDFYQVLRD